MRITNVRAICTAPEGIALVVVKVETSSPGLYGLGCATFTQRPLTVVTAVEEYLRPFLIGKDPAAIEDAWQSAYVSSYWRSGPVLNNALAGVDAALWDIKGKCANMPLYQLFGGKCRDYAALYAHAAGEDVHALEESVRAYMAQGYRYVRCQSAVPGLATYGARSNITRWQRMAQGETGREAQPPAEPRQSHLRSTTKPWRVFGSLPPTPALCRASSNTCATNWAMA